MAQSRRSGDNLFDLMSPRQVQTLDLLVRGATNAMIAESEGITLDAVKLRMRRLMRIANVRNRTQLAILWAQYRRSQIERPSGDDAAETVSAEMVAPAVPGSHAPAYAGEANGKWRAEADETENYTYAIALQNEA